MIFILFGCEDRKDNSREFHVYAGLDTTEVVIGDITRFQVWAIGTGKRKIEFPPFEFDNKNISMSEIKETQGEFKDDRGIEFFLTFWDTGSYQLPPYNVHILSEESGEVDYSIQTDPMTVKVHSLITGINPKLKNIKPPVPIPTIIPWKIIFSLVGIVLCALALVWMWRQRIQNDIGDNEEIRIPHKPPYEIAMFKLEELRNKLPSNPDSIKKYYGELSYLIREYVENQYFLRAIEMTTSEIEEAKFLVPVDVKKIDNVIDVLKRADLAKFARFQPSISFCVGDLQVIDDFLRYTRLSWTTIKNGVKPMEAI